MRRPLRWRPPQGAGGRPRGLRSRCARRARGRSNPSGGAPSRGRLASLHDTRACKSELQGAGTQPAAAPLTARPECSASERARREYAYLAAAAAARFGGTQPSVQVHQFHRILVELVLEGGEWDQPEATEEIDHEVSGTTAVTDRPEARSARPVACPELPAGRHDLPATPAPAERYLRREAIGQWVRLGVEDDVPPYAPNSAPYQNFAGRLSTWSTCTCFTSVCSSMR